MDKYTKIEFSPKVVVGDKEALALVYTPGVAFSSKEIAADVQKSYEYTNRENTVAVFARDIEKALERAVFLKSALNIDAYPLVVEDVSFENMKFILENLEPSFAAFDISLLAEGMDWADKTFHIGVPVLKGKAPDLKEFFLTVSKNAIIENLSDLHGNFEQKSLQLRSLKGGVIETKLASGIYNKPVAIISDGSAVLGLGNIGAEAGMPVMEGKAVLFKSLGGVDAMPLCIKTQKSEEIIKLVLLLEKSFSGVNLEDISAPRCFEVEEKLIEKASIPIFHDDQHGTAIVVLSALLNALKLRNSKISEVKIVFSGAGAAATAVAKLLIRAGAGDVTMCDVDGVVYKGRSGNSKALENLASITNKSGIKGTLEKALDGADVFIGLSAPKILTKSLIKKMNKNPIIFALANPTPEIMPDKAKEAGAFVVSTGRSDFPNQVNNSLVFPGLFNAILKLGIKKITEEIKLKTARAIAGLVGDEKLSKEYIIVDALDKGAVEAIYNALK